MAPTRAVTGIRVTGESMTVADAGDYNALTPDTVLHALESLGLAPSGRMLALNSYENRVYRIELEDAPSVISKFYRPGRWSDAAILEEHAFAQQLAADEIPVVAPLVFDSTTLHRHAGYRFAVFPVQGGRWPDLERRDDLEWMGRFLARIHAHGRRENFQHRQGISVQHWGHDSRALLLDEGFIPAHLVEAYTTLTRDLISGIDRQFARAGEVETLRIHGDCHRGNVLWTDAGPHFVDFDDCCNGPAVQDLWMLLSGEREEMTLQLADILAGYEEFGEFDRRELHLVEALRALRMLHYAAWLARRWIDPAFPQAFPWFNTVAYWEQHVLELREQFARLQEPVLVV
jgi:Ser/Thr protein kinase RdoA (MazF antagonist)